MNTALRFITCGSVDDGKSSLIGRLLLESRQIFDDQLKSIEKDSRKYGTQGDAPDLALLVDGLQAEREQGITIDVAYRFFQTPHRRFIVADTPGHEQYTRNMATAASTAQLAVVLIDARKGVLVQTRRHSRIAAMLGIRHIVLAINKMDLVDWREEVYAQITQEFRDFAATLNVSSIDAIPLSALKGDNVVSPGTTMSWYHGPSLLGLLEKLDVDRSTDIAQFCMPVQLVNRPNADFRGFCGRIASGTARVGDAVRINGKGVSTRIQSIVVYGAPLTEAQAGASITLTLADEVDVSRGDVVGAAGNTREPADQFQAHVIWMSEQPLVAGRAYFLKIHTQTVGATVTAIRHQIDVNTGAHLAAKTLQLNEIAVVNISLDRNVIFTPYRENRVLGGFIMIDRMSNATMGAGMVDFELRRASNLHWQTLAVDKVRRSHMKSQRPVCIWFTGLSGAGKSTLANQLEKRLHAEGRHTFLLDGDNLRHGLNRDLGFVEADRAENIRRVAEVAKLMVEAGLVVIVSLISPYRADRERARSLFGPQEFVEVYVDASLAECEKRDPKGLYAKARRGEVKNFTGIDSVYEPPATPDLHLNTIALSSEECVDQLLHTLGPMLSSLDLPPTD